MSRGQDLLRQMSKSSTHAEYELIDDDEFYYRLNNEHTPGSIQYELNAMEKLFSSIKRIFENYDQKDKWF